MTFTSVICVLPFLLLFDLGRAVHLKWCAWEVQQYPCRLHKRSRKSLQRTNYESGEEPLQACPVLGNRLIDA